MNSDSGSTTSYWMATGDVPGDAPLTANITTDVCVVGGGICGLTTAFLLAKSGHSVVVLDDGPLAGGETSRTTAQLVTALDERYTELEGWHGEKGARLAAESHAAAIEWIERRVAEDGIDCDFERLDGYLVLAQGEKPELLREELAAVHRAGLGDVEYVERVPHATFDFGPALRYPRQGQFHILKYLRGLADGLRRMGAKLHPYSKAVEIEGGSEARVKTADGYEVRPRSIVVATNSPVNDLFALHTKQAPYRSYVLGFRVPAGRLPHFQLWDTEEYYHYVRFQKMDDGDDLLIVGGEDHKTGQADDSVARYASLEAWARTRFPEAGAVEYRWSGQVFEPVDGLAFIGRNPMDHDNVYVNTGDGGNGITHGTIAGLLISDLIAGRENPWAALYDPSRITLRATRGFLKENLNVAAQYGDLFTGGDVASEEEIPPGQGAVLRRGLKKVAVYRDDGGTFHRHSAICTHLGCVVAWNSREKSWDCPCHGSRFAADDGHVLTGPAIKGLPPAEAPDHDAGAEEPAA